MPVLDTYQPAEIPAVIASGDKLVCIGMLNGHGSHGFSSSDVKRKVRQLFPMGTSVKGEIVNGQFVCAIYYSAE